MDTLPTFLASVVRHGAQLVAGYLLTKGLVSDGQVEMVVGLIVSVVALGWSFVQKSNAKKALAAAEAAPAK